MQSLILGGVIGTFSGMIFALGPRFRAARQLQPRRDVLRADRARARWRGQGVRLDRRADAVLGRLRVHHQPADRVHQGRSGAGGRLHADRVDPGRAGHVHADRVDADAADDVQATGRLRQPQGDGLRWDDDAVTARRCPMPPRRPSRRLATAVPEPGSAKPDPILVAHEMRPPLRRHHRRRRRARRGPARIDHRPDRSQRRRQDHVLQPADRVRRAEPRPLAVRRHGDGRRRSPQDRQDGHGPHVPAHQEPDEVDGDREHEARRHRPARREVVERARAIRCGAARRPRSRHVRTSCSRASRSTTCATSTPAHCRVASASCSRWRGR